MDEDDLTRSDVEALGAARHELGRSYEPDLLESFADKVEEAIEVRVRQQLARRDREHRLSSRVYGQQLALAIVSLVAALPITLALALNGQVPAMVIAWAGIVAINAAHALLGRRLNQ